MDEANFSGTSAGTIAESMVSTGHQDRAKPIGPAEIERALSERRLVLHYMPTIDLRDGRCVGAEALLRWPVPTGGFVAPDDFIPLAEASGLAEAVTAYVIRGVAQDLGPLLRARADLHISINIPPETVGSGFGQRILEETCLIDVKGQLIAEITERQALTKAGQAAMNENRKNGLRVAVDDFGTGHSGLSQLIDLEVDYLKIDRSFIEALRSERGVKLVRATSAAAAVLGADLIAEGVETARQAKILADIGVAYGQGWYWSRDLTARDFHDFVAR